MSDARPPRLAERLLRWTLPHGAAGQSIKGDLDQEHRELQAANPGRSFRFWYWREALGLAFHFIIKPERSSWNSPSSESRKIAPMDRLRQNVRYALRRFRRSPVFTTVAVVTIALGIGANVAIFSVVNTVVLEPLPYRQPERLAAIDEWDIAGGHRATVNPGNYRDWRESSQSFQDMAALMISPVVVITAGAPEEITLGLARSNLFGVLGVDAALGRTFSPESGTSDGELELVLTHRYWQRNFGGDRNAIGQTINIQGTAVPIVGVLPPIFMALATDAEAWLSYSWANSDQATGGRFLRVVGRLRDEVGWQEAQREMDAISARLTEEYPEFGVPFGVRIVPLQERITGNVKARLWILLGAVGLLLLIACANVANLFLARTAGRRREMAIRSSLGASGRRLTGQLFTESLLIALMGAALGVFLAHFGTRWIAASMPNAYALPRIEAAGLDGRALAFAVAVMVLTGLLFGLAPALHGSSVAPAAALSSEERGPGLRSGRARKALVVLEVALSCLLLVSAGLLGRSFLSLVSVDPGFKAENLLIGRINTYGPGYREAEVRLRFYDELLAGIAALPGVETAGAAIAVPMAASFNQPYTFYYPEDRPPPERAGAFPANIRAVHGDYFAAMGIPLLRGRAFDERDRANTPTVAVVSRAVAERHWPGEDAVGKRIAYEWGEWESAEIVGVVGDVHRTPEQAPPEFMYFPNRQMKYGDLVLAIRSTGEPASLAPGVREVLASLDPSLTVSDVRVMEDVVADSVSRPRMTSFLMTVFAGLAALIAAVGLYGVLSYAVSLRVREMGIRMAIGAGPADVLVLILRQGLGLVGVGLLLGLISALAVTRVLRSLLFGIEPTDPVSLVGAVVLLLVVSLAASAVPAWRATRVQPVQALSAE